MYVESILSFMPRRGVIYIVGISRYHSDLLTTLSENMNVKCYVIDMILYDVLLPKKIESIKITVQTNERLKN